MELLAEFFYELLILKLINSSIISNESLGGGVLDA
jgi:hypothetical protein